jgi:hypothetical protein
VATSGPTGGIEGDDVDGAMEDIGLGLPPPARQRRCGALHDVGVGPWIGTMACCTRPLGHTGAHAMLLGDPDSPSFWEEHWG